MDDNNILGVLDPRQMRDHLRYIDGLGTARPEVLFNLFHQIRSAELVTRESSPEWQAIVAATRRAIQKALHMEHEAASRLASLHVRTMLGENLVWPTFISAYLSRPEVFRPQIYLWGKEHLDAACQHGKGAILAQCHWGGFQMLLPALLMYGYSVFQYFGDREAAGWAEDVIGTQNPSLLQKMEVLVVPDPAVAKRTLQAIESGYLVAIPPEVSESATKPKLRAKLFGMEIYAPEGPAFLAATAGVPLIPVRVEAQGASLHCHFGQPIEVTKSRSGIQTAVEKYFRGLEEAVLASPHQWRGWGFLDEMLVPEQEEVTL